MLSHPRWIRSAYALELVKNMLIWMPILEFTGIALGIVTALWGFYHQLIVGSTASLFTKNSAREVRMFVMSWTAQGSFISFCGLLPASLLFFHGAMFGAVQTALLLSGAALILLSVHAFIIDFKQHILPIRLGAVLQFVYGLYLIFFVILSHPIRG